jgi:hypothetical protein
MSHKCKAIRNRPYFDGLYHPFWWFIPPIKIVNFGMDPGGHRFGLLGSLCGRPTDPPGCGTTFYGEKHDEERMFFLQARIARCSSVFRNNEYTNSGVRTTVSLDNFLVCLKILKWTPNIIPNQSYHAKWNLKLVSLRCPHQIAKNEVVKHTAKVYPDTRN